MVKSKLALIIDSVLLSNLISFLSFLWLNRIIKNANLVNFYSILILLASFILIVNLLFKSNNKKIFKNNNHKHLNNCLNKLIICPFDEYKFFLSKLLNCKHLDNFMFQLNCHFLYINLKTELSPNDYFLAQEVFYKSKSDDSKLYFIFNTKSKKFDELINLSPLNPQLLEKDVLLKLMATKKIYPTENNTTPKEPLKQKLLKNIKLKTQGITNKHFKELFFSGLSLLFLSLIVPFSNYYLISGTILLIISIITLFKKSYKSQNNDSDFLFK